MLGSYTLTMNGMTATLAHNLAKGTTALTATKKLPGGQVHSFEAWRILGTLVILV